MVVAARPTKYGSSLKGMGRKLGMETAACPAARIPKRTRYAHRAFSLSSHCHLHNVREFLMAWSVRQHHETKEMLHKDTSQHGKDHIQREHRISTRTLLLPRAFSDLSHCHLENVKRCFPSAWLVI